jgi:hypothetical protein
VGAVPGVTDPETVGTGESKLLPMQIDVDESHDQNSDQDEVIPPLHTLESAKSD